MAAKKPTKGEAGKNTGSKTRSAIKSAQDKGCTLAQIAAGSNRDASTISAIKSGKIANPPANLATAVQKACKNAKTKAKKK